MIYTQPAHLEQAAGRALGDQEADLHRAGYVRNVLVQESDPPSGEGGDA